MADLKLFGSWASSYTHRVQLALKLKGLDFEYIEEDLANKSPSLLLHNPIYKKVPVLLHRARPVAESVIILHYLDETWPDVRPLLPAAPYDRALARFWCHFADDKLGPAVGAVFASPSEGQGAAVEQEVMKVKLVDPEAFPFFHSWLRDFEEHEEVKEIMPAIDRLLEYAGGVRQMMLSLSNQQQ
ncbi:hypothetical protein Cni_G15483 [Canna indica]|uniref:Glutathione S-transferase n=1 Tax=Canna indica TaxID=4628 RepID=A0AAQ3KDW9_9LILI|nr:hypothetical protein Cni_G15481 [Canna indica]WOL06749.1 hypothetical protein Cni_G15483 [Canna indica]